MANTSNVLITKAPDIVFSSRPYPGYGGRNPQVIDIKRPTYSLLHVRAVKTRK